MLNKYSVCLCLAITHILIVIFIISLYIICPYIFTFEAVNPRNITDDTVCTCNGTTYTYDIFVNVTALSDIPQDLMIANNIIDVFNNNTYTLYYYTTASLNHIQSFIEDAFSKLEPYIYSSVSEPNQLHLSTTRLSPDMYVLCALNQCYSTRNQICMGFLTPKIIGYMLMTEILLIITNICVFHWSLFGRKISPGYEPIE